MAEVWLIEARFKSMGEGPWSVQRLPPLMDSQEAEKEVKRLTLRNTLSEWRAVRFIREPATPSDEVAQGESLRLLKQEGLKGYPDKAKAGELLLQLNAEAFPVDGAAQPDPQPAGTQPDVQRYELEQGDPMAGGGGAIMLQDSFGDYVRYEDYAALKQSNRRCIEALMAFNEVGNCKAFRDMKDAALDTARKLESK